MTRKILLAVLLCLVWCGSASAQPSGEVQHCPGPGFLSLEAGSFDTGAATDLPHWLDANRKYYSIVFAYTSPSGDSCDAELSQSIDGGSNWDVVDTEAAVADETVLVPITYPVGLYKVTINNCPSGEILTARYFCGASVTGR